MAQPTDEQLVARARQGNPDAFRTLVERYHDDLMRFLIRLTGSADAADDVFQDTFIQIFQSASTFDVGRRFKPWLFTIAANKARDHLRRKSRRQAMDLSAPVGGAEGGSDEGGTTFVDLLELEIPDVSSGLEDEERDRMVQQALDRLPLPLKEILLLSYFQRLTYGQIADELGIPLGTVKSRLHAAVAAFARQWKLVSKGSDR